MIKFKCKDFLVREYESEAKDKYSVEEVMRWSRFTWVTSI